MKSLNACISINDRTQRHQLTPTRYWELYRVSEHTLLLLHLLTGAIDLVTNEEATLIQDALATGNLSVLSDDLLAQLVKRGYLASPKNEQLFIDSLAERHQHLLSKKPIEFFIGTTFSCPVGCTYCFEGNLTRVAKAYSITKEQIDAIFSSIEQIKDMQRRPLKEIVLFGGEPLLPITMQAVHEILRQASQRKYPVTVYTSGIFARDFVEMFRKYANTVKLVRVTIDGPGKIHNKLRTLPEAFEKAADGIDALLQAGIPVMTRTNVGRYNLESLSEMVDYFHGRGWLNYEIFDPIVTGIKDRGACIGDKEQLLREDELAVRFLQMRMQSSRFRSLRPVNVFAHV